MNTGLMPLIYIIVAMTSIQFGAASAKLLFPVTGAIGTTLLRLLLASAMLLLLWRPWRQKLSTVQLKAVLWYGLSLGLMNLSFYLAIERIPLGLAVALEFSGPLTLALLNSRKKSDFLWALLAALGILLISPISSASQIDTIGIIFALIVALFWALYIITGQKASLVMHEGVATSLGMVIGALVILPVALINKSYESINIQVMPEAFLVALFSSAIPYSLEMFALKRMSKFSFGILMSLGPAMAALMGLLVLQEILSLTQIIAIAFIIFASLGNIFVKDSKASQKLKESLVSE